MMWTCPEKRAPDSERSSKSDILMGTIRRRLVKGGGER